MNELFKLSICLIVKNEADRIEKTLAPFIGKVSEILVYLDDRTTDGTLEILKKLGSDKNKITVVSGPWLGFSATRRALWSMAKEEWILWVDGDEVFSQETINSLASVSKETDMSGYRIKRRVIFDGKTIRHGDWGNDHVLRVFRRDNFVMAERIVHESVNVKGKVVDLPGIVEHHSFRNWADLEARSQKYAELWAQQAFEAKKRGGSPFIHAVWKFIRGYIVKSGWLDGALGFKIALHNAREVFQKYQRLNKLCDQHRQHGLERV